MLHTTLDKSPQVVLQGPAKQITLKVAAKNPATHDSFHLKLAFENPSTILGNQIGQCVKIYSKDMNGKEIGKYFAPVSPVDQQGFVDFLIRVYQPLTKESYEGYFSRSLSELKVGDQVNVDGPHGGIVYKGAGQLEFVKLGLTRSFKNISFIAGGAAIFPFYQMIRAIAKDPQSDCVANVLYASKTEKDIMLREELESLQGSTKCKMDLILSQPDTEWHSSKGYINHGYLNKNLVDASNDHFVFFYGPPRMSKDIAESLNKLGHSLENIFLFNTPNVSKSGN